MKYSSNRSEVASQALSNAIGNASVANYGAIFAGFAEKGIAESEIKPRENVFTYHAWRALGRQVRKGEHGVRIGTWVEMTKSVDGEKVSLGRRPKGTTVFHISQTDPVEG